MQGKNICAQGFFSFAQGEKKFVKNEGKIVRVRNTLHLGSEPLLWNSTTASYRLLAQMGTEKISDSPFYFFFYVCNDSANAVEDFGILFLQIGSLF